MIGLAKIAASDGMNLAKSKLITPPICKGFIKKHFKFSQDQSPEDFLRELGIVPKVSATGVSYLDGLDFTNSSLFATKDYDIVLHVEYQVQVLPWLPVDIKLNFCQTAITRGWSDGDGRHISYTDGNVTIATRVNGSLKEEPAPTTPATVTVTSTSGSEITVTPTSEASIDANEEEKETDEGGLKTYTGGRTQEELDDLARDPAHAGSTRADDINQGLLERKIGLDLEETGRIEGPITRDPTGKAEFYDANGQAWDVKSFNSNFKPSKGGYTLNNSMKSILKALSENENVILDTTNLYTADKEELIQELINQGLMDKIIVWP